MSQPGRPDKPDAFWFDLDKELLKMGWDPTLAGPILTILQRYVKELQVRVFAQPSHTSSEVWAMIRDHIYGWPRI